MFKLFKKEEPEIREIDFIQQSLRSMMIDFTENFSNIDNSLEETDKKELYRSANELLDNKAFKMISRYLINCQGNYAVRQAEDYNKVCFSRAVINGIELIKEEADRLNGLYNDLNKNEESFDKRKII